MQDGDTILESCSADCTTLSFTTSAVLTCGYPLTYRSILYACFRRTLPSKRSRMPKLSHVSSIASFQSSGVVPSAPHSVAALVPVTTLVGLGLGLGLGLGVRVRV